MPIRVLFHIQNKQEFSENYLKEGERSVFKGNKT